MPTNTPKISVVTWNGGFRESFHTVDFFANQTISFDDYEFIWVEFYEAADSTLVDKLDKYHNTKLICLNGEGQWHAGRCMNAGVNASKGELVIIVDGDIAVKSDFLEKVWEKHSKQNNLVLYLRRWDEIKEKHLPDKSRHSIDYLTQTCQLLYPENYAGCISLRRETIDLVNGYEEHPIFGGAGAVSKELYGRLRNAGLPILWHPTEKVFHPWHPGTIPSYNNPKVRKQKWLIRQRSLKLNTVANPDQIENYLKDYQDIPHAKSKPIKHESLKTRLKKFLNH